MNYRELEELYEWEYQRYIDILIHFSEKHQFDKNLIQIYNFQVLYLYEEKEDIAINKIFFFENNLLKKEIIFYIESVDGIVDQVDFDYYLKNNDGEKEFLDKLLSYHKLQIGLKEKENKQGVKKI